MTGQLTFGIRSSGAREDVLGRLIRSIHALNVPEYEILVCGITKLNEEQYRYKLILAETAALNCQLGRMCNMIADEAKYPFICYLDDDMLMSFTWWEVMSQVPSDWDLTAFGVVDDELKRTWDWAELVDGNPVLKNWDTEANDRTYISNGALLIKTEAARKLRWSEMGRAEDNELCFRAYKEGYKLKVYQMAERAMVKHFWDKRGRHEFKITEDLKQVRGKAALPNLQWRDNPLVSVVIPTWNRAKLVQKAIKSVMEQSYKNLEIIVVDDCSSDDTQAVLSKMDGIRYIRHEENLNTAHALNTGIRNAKGDFICWLSSDDFWHEKDKVKIQLEAFEQKPNLRLVHSEWDVVWENSVSPPSLHRIPEIKTREEGVEYHLNKECLINGTTAMMRRELFKEVGMFNPAYRYLQDTDMWARTLAATDVACVHKSLASNLQHSGILGNEFNFKKTGKEIFMRYVWDKEYKCLRKFRRILGSAPRPKICAMICMKNEEELIAETLNDLIQWVDSIVVFNDGSLDTSPEIIRQYPKVVDVFDSPPKGNVRTEGKDRKKLYEMARSTHPDWILFIDADEIFENMMKWIVYDLITDEKMNLYYAHEVNFWRGKTHYRIDELWNKGWFPRLFRNLDKLKFQDEEEHCGGVPYNIPGASMFPGEEEQPKGRRIKPRVKHYGFSSWERTKKKYELLMERDPRHFDKRAGVWKGGKDYYDRIVNEEGIRLQEYEGDRVIDYVRRSEI